MTAQAIETNAYLPSYAASSGAFGFDEGYAYENNLPERKAVVQPAIKAHFSLSLRDKVTMFVILFVIAAVFFISVSLSAYLASIQKDINKINAESARLNEEIDKLYVKIEMGRNISTIEKSANKMLGLDYAEDDRIRYLSEAGYNEKKDDMIQYIREKVYGTSR